MYVSTGTNRDFFEKKALKSGMLKIDMSNFSKFSGQNSANNEMINSIHRDSLISQNVIFSQRTTHGQEEGEN